MGTPAKRVYPVVEIWSNSPYAPSTHNKKIRLASTSLPVPPQRAPLIKTETPSTPLFDTTSTPPHGPTASTSTHIDTKAETDRKYPLPPAHWKLDLPELESFFDFMYERHKAHLERIAQYSSMPSTSTSASSTAPPPFKRSMSMKEKAKHYISSNLYRELDAGTQDFVKKVVNIEELQPVATDSSQEKYTKFEDAVFRTMLYRVFNKPLTYSTLISNLASLSPPLTPSYSNFLSSRPSFNSAYDKMHKAFEAGTGEALTTNQYMIIATGIRHRSNTVDWSAKLDIVRDVMQGKYWDKKEKRWVKGQSLPKMVWETVVEGKVEKGKLGRRGGRNEMIFKEIQKFDLFGSFLAYQLLLDLNYLPQLPLSFSLENDNWVNYGNGSKSGLTYSFTGNSLRDNEVLDAMRYLNRIQDREWERIRSSLEGGKTKTTVLMESSLPPSLPGSRKEKPGLVEFEHTLCEYSKFRRGAEKQCQYIPTDRKIDFVIPRKFEMGYVDA